MHIEEIFSSPSILKITSSFILWAGASVCVTELLAFALSPPVPGEHSFTQELICLGRVSVFFLLWKLMYLKALLSRAITSEVRSPCL